MAEKRLVLFRINKQVYGMDIDKVNAIEPVAGTVHVPNAPGYIEGIVNLRGSVVPVYSIHSKFNIATDASESESKLIITQSGGSVFAFSVDAVDEIHVVDSKDLSTPPKVLQGDHTSYINEIANIKGNLVLCLNVDRMLSDAEKESMKDFVEAMKEE